MNVIHSISAEKLTLQQIEEIVSEGARLSLSPDSIGRIKKCRDYLDKKLATAGEPLYGINTGFGALYDMSISQGDLGKLQKNLVMSHACGIGEEVPAEIVKLMLFLKAQ